MASVPLICPRCLTVSVRDAVPLGDHVRCDHCTSQFIAFYLVRLRLPDGYSLYPPEERPSGVLVQSVAGKPVVTLQLSADCAEESLAELTSLGQNIVRLLA